jgi:hypothetical protein
VAADFDDDSEEEPGDVESDTVEVAGDAEAGEE